MSQIPVQDAEKWFRDSSTGSLSCADEDTYQKYMRAHKAEEVKKQQFEALQNDVSLLKSDMSEIKSLLKKLAN
tara:strand:+ start:101 stop:319 length:219 start_codon:yes stop_codon:yes gene_type:complete